jgi:tetratricopeptide (TPR) repeat protein
MGRQNPAGSPTWRLLLAILILSAGILLSPGSADTSSETAAAHLRRGDDLMVQKMYHEALDEYDAAVALDPYNSIAWNKLGVAHMRTGRYDDAVLVFERSIGLDPYNSDAWTNLGDSLAMLGKHQEAIRAYDGALGINQRDINALLRKGMSLQETGDSTGAMEIYQEVIRLADLEMRKHPNYAGFDAELWTNKGDALSRLGRHEEAVTAYDAALEINPKFERAEQGRTKAMDAILLARGNPVPGTPVTEENSSQPLPTIVPVSGISIICSLVLAAGLTIVKTLRRKS